VSVYNRRHGFSFCLVLKVLQGTAKAQWTKTGDLEKQTYNGLQSFLVNSFRSIAPTLFAQSWVILRLLVKQPQRFEQSKRVAELTVLRKADIFPATLFVTSATKQSMPPARYRNLAAFSTEGNQTSETKIFLCNERWLYAVLDLTWR